MNAISTSMGRPWMSVVLVIAGIYNLLFGAWAVLFPESIFEVLDMEPPNYASCGSASE